MSLLLGTPGFFQRGIQTLTNLFRPKSEPSPLNGIQQINHYYFYLRVI
jgi:hypothetical protein